MGEAVELTARDRAIIALEIEQLPRGSKEDAIRRRFEISPARYYQLLNRLLESPTAIAEWPLEVKRLRRLRDERTARRSARSFAD